MSEPVRFSVWSDVLCPWCYVAAVRLDALQHEYPDQLTLEWRSFLLQPEITPKPIDRFRNYTQRWLRPGGPASVEPAAHFRVWGDETPPSHSVPAAIAVKAAASFGTAPGERYHLALMRAYFDEHRDVSSRSVVVAVADEVGVDTAEFAERLGVRGAEFRKDVTDDYADALDRGIYAAPTVLVNDVFPITGAQDVDFYRRMIERFSASSS